MSPPGWLDRGEVMAVKTPRDAPLGLVHELMAVRVVATPFRPISASLTANQGR
jgi:hypothetical protein